MSLLPKFEFVELRIILIIYPLTIFALYNSLKYLLELISESKVP
ncbi:hypothetical protein CNEO3_150063 [Clostridium neonatale]|nr:hypothetical protein CNEO3_130062 [Clostridium neonatale]CAI3587884.1 hypothetical protein CNEO3_170070 [Clostridium neonatale]CAI3590615.1 hypothetical protein CNEO3_150062 [Clostridium neonatale]CAI3592677.1 hypothetical protein CNEO3_150063 [Clostridium neonatale]CAI3628343.1 hypothetical protein CNEO3_210048 [Clostridium neonatale]